MRAGDLDKRILIERDLGTTKDSYGQPVENWSTFATVWAKLTPVSGREQMKAGAETQTQTVVFRIRFLAGVEPKMRLTYRGAIYDIENVANATEQRDRYLDLTATAREVKAGA